VLRAFRVRFHSAAWLGADLAAGMTTVSCHATLEHVDLVKNKKCQLG
jgi:hypothetical protein